MLNIPAPFPCTGSSALFDGYLWRVLRHNDDGTVLLGREGQSAGGQSAGGQSATLTRSAPLAALLDPESEIAHAAHRMVGLRIASRLADADETSTLGLIAILEDELAAGRIRYRPSPSALAGIMETLGWTRFGTRYTRGQSRQIAQETAV